MQKLKIEQLGTVKEIQGQKGMFKVFSIKAGGEWYSGYFNEVTSKWTVGQEVEVTVTSKEKDGKTYKNFVLPKSVDLATDRIAKAEGRIMTLELSFERKFEELKAKIKSDLMLELGGKVQTDADFEQYSKPHPMSSNPLDGIAPDDEIPF